MEGSVRLELLQPPVASAFASMTYPAYRHLLQLQPAPKLLSEPGSLPVQPVAVAALEVGRPVGLMLAALPLVEGELPELLSIYVVPEGRGRGVGTALVAAAEKAAAAAGFSSLAATWTEGASGSEWWVRQVATRGWQAPARRSLSVLFTAEEALRFPWLDRLPLREGCEIVPLSEVKDEEWEALRRSQEANPWIAPDLVPWRYTSQGFEEKTSVALRSAEGIMGWVINHRLAADWLRFTCSFIRKDWGRRARILPLFSASLHRMVAAGFVKASFVAPVRHPTMVRFVEGHMAPWVRVARWTWGSTKDLRQEATPTAERQEEEVCEQDR